MEKRWDRRAEWTYLFPRFFAGGPIFDFSKQHKWMRLHTFPDFRKVNATGADAIFIRDGSF